MYFGKVKHNQTWSVLLLRTKKEESPYLQEATDTQRLERALATTYFGDVQTENVMAELQAGGRASPRKRKAIEKDRRLKELQRRLDDGECSIGDYLESIKYLTGL